MRFSRLRVPIVVTLLAALATASGVMAQPTGTPRDLSGGIYQGPCDSLNQNATWQAGDFIEVDDANLIGYTDVGPLLRAEGLVDTTMDDLFRAGGAYSYVVTDNSDPNADPVACGRLGGVMVNGQVVIGLYADFLADEAEDEGNLVGVAVFGSTAGAGDRAGQGAVTAPQQTPTTGQQAQLPENVPVQAYLFLDELDDDESEPTATVASQQPLPTNTPVPPTSTSVPPTATTMPTEAPTMMPTEMPTMAPPTEAPPTMAPPTQAPPTEDSTMEATEED